MNKTSFLRADHIQLGIKLIIIGLLILLFLIPLTMIRSLVNERQGLRSSVEQEIADTQGGIQTICGPVIQVPYREIRINEDGEAYDVSRTAYFLPESLDISASNTIENRQRGIYTVPVYTVACTISGRFTQPDLSEWDIPDKQINWEKALISFDIPDRRTLLEGTILQWGEAQLPMKGGRQGLGVYRNSLWTELPGEMEDGSISFSMNLSLKGSRGLYFTPMGGTTTVSLASEWPSPSFNGAYLPRDRELRDDGCSAQWHVLSLARNFPQTWNSEDDYLEMIRESRFGLSYYLPVDIYQQAERSVKYGVLFIIIPFLCFFLFETTRKIRIHPLQYILVGFAECVFYVLLISLSEHFSFGLAFLIAAGATTGLITFYASAVLKGRSRGLSLLPILSAGYLFLYVVIRSEDYALLIGSLGLFLMLAAVMVITRNINWYKLKKPDDPVPAKQ